MLNYNCSLISKVATALLLCPIIVMGGGCANASNRASSDSSDMKKHDETVNDTKSSNYSAFEYREAYLPDNIDSVMSDLLRENNVGRDWGIWGHNIYRVVGENADSTVYATIDGEINYEQYCFSSPKLHDLLYGYIADNYGVKATNSSRFLIMPNDNDLACTCEQCRRAGNSDGNATPAVASLVARLAKEFPDHYFFMGAYGTTATPPADEMPANVGVMVSAMGWQLSPMSGGAKRNRFDALVKKWSTKCHKIYVWDYINNFNDYFTPFPVLRIMQSRLQHYHDIGVSGVFLNGSGEDYSSFGDLHNAVLASLMIDPYINVDKAIREFFKKNYPTAGRMLADNYLRWEDAVARNRKQLDIYGPTTQSSNYLGGYGLFGKFYVGLTDAINAASGDERLRLERLQAALSYTMLELARIDGALNAGALKMVYRTLLRSAEYDDMEHVSESGLTVAEYLNCWDMSISGYEQTNMLAGRKLTALTQLDSGYRDLSVLTDGVNGLPCGYHYGWLISSLGDRLEIKVPLLPGARRLEVSFLKLTRHRIALPVSIELLKDGVVVASQTADDAAEADVLREDMRRLVYSFDVQQYAKSGGDVVLRMTRPKSRINHLAIDEIRLKK